MSDPYFPDSQDDEQEIPFDQYDESFDQDPPPPQRRAQGSQPEWQGSNPNTQQDQWGQQQNGRKRKNSPQSDQMNAQDPDDDDMRAADQSNQANSQYPRPSPQSQGAPDDSDDDGEYWRDDDWREDPSTW